MSACRQGVWAARTTRPARPLGCAVARGAPVSEESPCLLPTPPGGRALRPQARLLNGKQGSGLLPCAPNSAPHSPTARAAFASDPAHQVPDLACPHVALNTITSVRFSPGPAWPPALTWVLSTSHWLPSEYFQDGCLFSRALRCAHREARHTSCPAEPQLCPGACDASPGGLAVTLPPRMPTPCSPTPPATVVRAPCRPFMPRGAW